MSITIAILGLAFLILLHEAGHFFVARAVGMSPRRFYLGFPPALVKVKRKGTEYGIGAIPLGGYVKIPGMHRPAASDLDALLGPAMNEDSTLFPKVARVKRSLEQGDLIGAREGLPELERALDEAKLSKGAERMARRGFNELRDGLADDAYWRQRTSKRVAVIFAGPAANILLAILLPMIAYLIGAPGHTSRTVDTVQDDSPADSDRTPLGRPDRCCQRPLRSRTSMRSPHRSVARTGSRSRVTVVRRADVRVLGPVKTEEDRRPLRAWVHAAAGRNAVRPRRGAVAQSRRHLAGDEGDRHVLTQTVHRLRP